VLSISLGSTHNLVPAVSATSPVKKKLKQNYVSISEKSVSASGTVSSEVYTWEQFITWGNSKATSKDRKAKLVLGTK